MRHHRVPNRRWQSASSQRVLQAVDMYQLPDSDDASQRIIHFTAAVGRHVHNRPGAPGHRKQDNVSHNPCVDSRQPEGHAQGRHQGTSPAKIVHDIEFVWPLGTKFVAIDYSGLLLRNEPGRPVDFKNNFGALHFVIIRNPNPPARLVQDIADLARQTGDR